MPTVANELFSAFLGNRHPEAANFRFSRDSAFLGNRQAKYAISGFLGNRQAKHANSAFLGNRQAKYANSAVLPDSQTILEIIKKVQKKSTLSGSR